MYQPDFYTGVVSRKLLVTRGGLRTGRTRVVPGRMVRGGWTWDACGAQKLADELNVCCEKRERDSDQGRLLGFWCKQCCVSWVSNLDGHVWG